MAVVRKSEQRLFPLSFSRRIRFAVVSSVLVLIKIHAFCPVFYRSENWGQFETTRLRTTFVLLATSSKRLKEERREQEGGKSHPKPHKAKRKKQSAVKRLARAAANAATLYPPTTPTPYAQRQQQASPPASQASASNNANNNANIGTLQQLTHAIDKQLQTTQSTQLSSFSTSSPLPILRQPPPLQPRDRMSALLEYNDEHERVGNKASRLKTKTRTLHVAVVFGKALQDDQVTVEYSARIQSLVQLLLAQSSLSTQNTNHDHQLNGNDESTPTPLPDVICFCGGGTTSTATNAKYHREPGNKSEQQHTQHLTTAQAGHVYFRHLCATYHVDLSQVQLYVQHGTISDDDGTMAIAHVAKHLQTQYIPQWLKEEAEAAEAAALEATMVQPQQQKEEMTKSAERQNVRKRHQQQPQPRIHLHFTLISTGYHLCNLNDVHHRSPGQSLLRPLERLRKEYSSSVVFRTNDGNYNDFDGDDNDDDDDEHFAWDDDDYEEDYDYHVSTTSSSSVSSFQQQTGGRGGIVETSWSYRYAQYPYLYAREDSVAFLARCFLLGEELMPLHVNLRGVVQEKEFFQRDNYLVLASIRRSLVSQMEELYKTKPRLQSDLRTPAQDVNVVMEGVVLSLGRCIDLVRPAGLLVGSVSKTDYVKAFRALENAISQIRMYCDPDAPLDPREWGKLQPSMPGIEDKERNHDVSNLHERLYTQLDSSSSLQDEHMANVTSTTSNNSEEMNEELAAVENEDGNENSDELLALLDDDDYDDD